MCEWQRNKHCKEAWIKKMLCSKYFCEKLFMNGPLLSILKASEMSSLLLHLAKTCRCFIIPSVNHFLICDWCSTWQSTVKDPGRVLLDPTSWSLHPAITTAEIQLFPVHQNWMGVWTWTFYIPHEGEASALLSGSWSSPGCVVAPPPDMETLSGAQFEPESALQHPVSLSALSFLRAHIGFSWGEKWISVVTLDKRMSSRVQSVFLINF